jgi:putative transposase
VKRAFKYRFYPTPAQADQLARTFGSVRKVYNLALEARSTAWREHGQRIGFAETSAFLTAWKKTEEYAYLNDVSSVPLQQVLRHLNAAYTNFFAGRAGYPRFKSRKRSRDTAEYTRSAFRWRDGQVTLAKHNEPLPIVWSRPLPKDARPSTVTVSHDKTGRWFVSVLVEDIPVMPDARAGSSIGIDAGLNHLLALSTGEKISNPHHEQRDRKALVRAQRALSRKQPGSANRTKARMKVARIHARVSDRRRDHLHQISTRLVRESQTLVIEDLHVAGMLRNHRLARAISDASWAEFRRMIEYKAAWYGRTLVVVDRWLPSSKLCSACGRLQETMPLKVREWTCSCGARHDRDVNAARNVLAAGLAVTACGAGVRPQRDSVPVGRSVMKQEVVPTAP